jgi:hypothetical protein
VDARVGCTRHIGGSGFGIVVRLRLSGLRGSDTPSEDQQKIRKQMGFHMRLQKEISP